MHFDRLDESYAMAKSILPFGQLDQTGLTYFGIGLTSPSSRVL